jgi:ribosomal protein S18 acetylase RimI-like enzyme
MNLVPMSQAYFTTFVERLVVEYAEDKVRSGNWPEAGSLKRSRDEITHLLPRGLETEGQALFELAVPGEEEPAGALWLAVTETRGAQAGFIYDLWIRPDLRRKGFGVQAMREAEVWAKAQGVDSLALHVFGHNPGALALYNKLAYRVTNINMTKELTSSASSGDSAEVP